MFFRPKKLYKYLTTEGAQNLFSSNKPAIWFRFPNRLNDTYDLRPIGSCWDEFGAIGTFCLSETPQSAPMWAHYGSEGKGVVLEFSFPSEFFAKYPPLKVRYRSTRATVKSAHKALTTKNIEWAYEREWRCLLAPPGPRAHEHALLEDVQAISVPFPFEALTAIIHGYDSRVSAEEFLTRPETSHVVQLVCRTRAWGYGFDIRARDDISHIFESRDAALWGRQQRRK